ncbi:Smr/MutS family protein [Salinicola aestuarinus]|uniref:Smr/MutS family protein n=1 Tax=Salinicola aestuarinus TaxID=1949082 RepID=UPI000DA17C4E|nr:Smr/MutS family protein [Salinicola aestuarinus]
MTQFPDDDDDHNAFRQALEAAGVRKLKTNRANVGRPRKTPPGAAARRAAATQATTAARSQLSDGGVEAVTPHQRLEFAIPDLPARTFAKLKRGQIGWEGGLDLHGYTIDEARLELEAFIDDALATRARCVLVVHGKARGTRASGVDYPVIKSHVNAWLKHWSRVLAFCSASDVDGGTGAVYVLLRTRDDRDER